LFGFSSRRNRLEKKFNVLEVIVVTFEKNEGFFLNDLAAKKIE
jgi:hypothetical protein